MTRSAPCANSARVRPAGAGTNLDDGHAFERTRGAGDARRKVQIVKEILPKRLARVEPVTRDDLAQRRQIVDHPLTIR